MMIAAALVAVTSLYAVQSHAGLFKLDSARYRTA